MYDKRNIKKVFSILLLLAFLTPLSACKEFAKDVGDAGNSLGKTIEDTINRNKD